MIWIIIFWTSIFLLLYSYILYPALLRILACKKQSNRIVYSENGDMPDISVIMSVYNEEKVLENKINSIYSTSFPKGKMEVIIGSDGSSDQTEEILRKMKEKLTNFSFYHSNIRRGKPNVLNDLVLKAKGDILLFTDANVFLNESTITGLVKHFKNPEIGLVDSRMTDKGIKKNGISRQESAYISMEVNLKNREGLVWGTMMGPFGGCYAMRKNLFIPIPENFLVDDFFLNLNVLKNRKKSINDMKATVSEDVSDMLIEEFRRKKRIAAGSFQNLSHYAGLLWPPYTSLSFSFISHKILRWFGPLFLILIIISNVFIFMRNEIYIYSIYLEGILIIITIIDLIVSRFNKHIVFFRYVTHFFAMNLALSLGLVNFLKGIKTNVWEPTKRNQ
ncbi:MAG: glycosyltransferase [Bacteroidales bacterium]|nr:glycosyltransferase [Bacteroidales bacterium]